MATPTQANPTRSVPTPLSARRRPTLLRRIAFHLAALVAAVGSSCIALWVCGVSPTLAFIAALLLGRVSAAFLFRFDRLRWGEWGLRDARLWLCATVCGSSLAALLVRTAPLEAVVRVLLVEALLYGVAGLLLDDLLRLRRRTRTAGASPRPCLVYGSRGTARTLAQNLLSNPGEFQPFAYLDDDAQLEETVIDGLPVLGGVDDLSRLAQLHHIADVLAASPTDELLEAADNAGIRVHYGSLPD